MPETAAQLLLSPYPLFSKPKSNPPGGRPETVTRFHSFTVRRRCAAFGGTVPLLRHEVGYDNQKRQQPRMTE